MSTAPGDEARVASRTATGVAMLRAFHQILDQEPRILDDPVVLRLLGSEVEAAMRESPARYRSPGAAALRSHVLLRSRFAEERLRSAVGRGITQAVSLGAGYDTFAWRQPEWSRVLRLYEVDHPASQAAKRRLLDRAGLSLPLNLTFVPIDFEHETLRDGLVAAGFDPGQPAFLSCLGVLVYLQPGAIRDLFRFVAGLACGSECVFTYGGTASPGTRVSDLAERAAAVGEPWISPLELEDVQDLLAEAGLPAPLVLSGAEAAAFMGNRTDGLSVPRRARIATVLVP